MRASSRLNEGPLIGQEMARVGYTSMPEGLAVIGRDAERVALPGRCAGTLSTVSCCPAARSSSGEPLRAARRADSHRPLAAIGRSGGKHSRDPGTPCSGETEVNVSFSIRKCPYAVADWLVLLQRD
jgi:hypothetical protein